MFTCVFIIYCLLNTTFASDLLTSLWEQEDAEEVLLFRSLKGEPLSRDENKLMIRRLSNLPFTDHLKSNLWHKIVRYRSVRSMDVNDWESYEPLIPYLPPLLLEEVNFSNPQILSYFGQQEFRENQLPQLAEEVSENLGDILNDKEKILTLGNIFCGFSAEELSRITEPVLRFLYENKFFQTLKACNPQQLAAITKLLMEFKILGPPRTWDLESLKQVGSLVAGLNAHELREIQEESFSEISPRIIELIPVEALKQLKDSQVKHFDRPTLLSWRRKTRDLRSISNCSRTTSNIFLSVMTAFLLVR